MYVCMFVCNISNDSFRHIYGHLGDRILDPGENPLLFARTTVGTFAIESLTMRRRSS